MAAGGEIDDGLAAVHGREDGGLVGDVALNKRMPGGVEVFEVVEVAGIGELVEIDDVQLGVGGEHVAHEVGADESRAAGDDNPCHDACFLRWM